jgi:ankyrin repeat protein
LLLGWTSLMASGLPAAEIHDAAGPGSFSQIEALVKRDPSVVASSDMVGDLPLHHAARAKQVEALELLIKVGADPNSVGHDGWTPLHLAAKFGPTDSVMVLLNGGARPDVKNSLGQTPSQVAAHDLIRRRPAGANPSMAGIKEVFDTASKGDEEALYYHS